MAIQPIDLQTMYSQLSNVSKTLSASQQLQLTEAMQQQNKIQKEIENAQKVQQTTNEKVGAKNVNQDGSNSQSFENQKKKKKSEDATSEDLKNRIKEERFDSSSPENENVANKTGLSYFGMGTIIDIKR